MSGYWKMTGLASSVFGPFALPTHCLKLQVKGYTDIEREKHSLLEMKKHLYSFANISTKQDFLPRERVEISIPSDIIWGFPVSSSTLIQKQSIINQNTTFPACDNHQTIYQTGKVR